jgi:hypothetical protein
MLEFAGVPPEMNTCEKITKQWNWRVDLRYERSSSFSVFLPCYLKGKYKRWPSIRPPCAECPRDASRLCTTCTNMHGDEALLLLKLAQPQNVYW